MALYAYNNWLASKNPADFGGLEPLVIAGESFAPGVRAGAVHDIFEYLATQLHLRVEPIIAPGWHEADEWGYYFKNSANSSKLLSCHSAGCAIDYNATRHPNGKRGTFTAAQVKEIRKILAELEGVVYWGGDAWGNGTPDEMHFEIATGVTEAQLVKVLAKLRGASYPPPVPVKPKPAPAPKWRPIEMGQSTALGTSGAQVKRDQSDLIDSGFSVGDSGADGYAGPATVEAIKAAQRAGGLLVDGEMGAKTRAMLHKVPSWSTYSIRRVQARLGVYGYRLVLDGKLGPKTKAAIVAFQKRVGLTPDGVVGPTTWTALHTR